MPKITFTRPQAFKLYEWLNKNAEIVKAKTAEELAEIATGELGFPVNKCIVSRMRKELGLVRVRAPHGSRKKERIDYGPAIKMLALELAEVRQSLDLPISRELQEAGK